MPYFAVHIVNGPHWDPARPRREQRAWPEHAEFMDRLVAAGLVVTRVAAERDEDSLGTEIGSQFFGEARTLWVVAGLSGALATRRGGLCRFYLALVRGTSCRSGLPSSTGTGSRPASLKRS